MKEIEGIFLPDGDMHFGPTLKTSPRYKGKATYQLRKLEAALRAMGETERLHAVDVGAHVGFWSRVLSYEFQHVTAFEPLSTHRECFVANVDLRNVELYGYALAEESKVVNVFMPEDNTGHAHVSDKGELCHAIPLDSIKIDPFQFLKIDVEGYELNVVRGAEKSIRTYKPTIIIEQKANNAEAQGAYRWDAVNLLKKWGMREIRVMAGDHIMVW